MKKIEMTDITIKEEIIKHLTDYYPFDPEEDDAKDCAEEILEIITKRIEEKYESELPVHEYTERIDTINSIKELLLQK